MGRESWREGIFRLREGAGALMCGIVGAGGEGVIGRVVVWLGLAEAVVM